jgi:sugar/nucleoside kinase (ribokinase family)
LIVGSNVVDIELDVDENFSHMHIGEKIVVEKDFKRTVGGAGINISIGISRFGPKVYYLGKLSEESYNTIKGVLDKNKVDIVKSKISKKPAAKSVIINTADNDRIIFTYRGQNSSLQLQDFELNSIDAKNIYFSSLGGESFETLFSIAKIAREKNSDSMICYTPSTRLIETQSRLKQFIALCDIMVLNYEEAEALVGEGGVSDCLKKCYNLGLKAVVITDGSNGAYGYDGKREYFQKSIPPEKFVDATGAGDCFTGTFFYFYASGYGMSKSMYYAAKNASNLIGVKGATDGMLYIDDLLDKEED